MLSVPFSISHDMVDLDTHDKIRPSISVSDNRFLVSSFVCSPHSPFSKKKRETFSASRYSLHHSVIFYFTVLSVPSQDSSHMMKQNSSVLTFIIWRYLENIKHFIYFFHTRAVLPSNLQSALSGNFQ